MVRPPHAAAFQPGAVQRVFQRAHAKWEHELEPGTVLFLGENGSGKSSVLMGMALALFGWSPYKSKELIRIGATTYRADVWFTHDKRSFRVAKGSSVNEMWAVRKNGEEEQVASGVVNVQSKVKEALGLTPTTNLSKLYQDVLGGRQGGFTAGFALGRTDRIKYWGTILDLQRYRQAYEKLRGAVSTLKNEANLHATARDSYQDMLETMRDQVAPNIATQDRLVKEIAEHTQRLQDLATQLQEAVETVRTKEAALSAVTVAVARLRTIRDTITDKNRRVSAAQQRYSQAKQRHDRYQVIGPKFDLLAGWKAVYDPETVPEYNHACHQVELFRQTVNNARQKEDEELARLEDLREQAKCLPTAKLTLLGYEEEHAEQNKLWQEMWDQASELTKQKAAILLAPVGGGTCPMCGNYVGAEQAEQLNMQRSQRRQALMDALEELSDKQDKFAQLMHTTEAAIAEIRVKNARIPTADDVQSQELAYLKMEATRVKLEEELKALADKAVELKPYADAAVELKEQIDEAEREVAPFVGYTGNEFSQAEVELKEAIDSLHKAEADVDDLDTLVLEQKEAEGELKEARLRVEELTQEKGKVGLALTELKHMQTLVGKIDESEQARVKVQARLDLLTKIRDTINRAGPVIANRTVRRIASDATQFWNRMGHSLSIEWSGDYQLSVGSRTFGMLSGGEQVAAALSIRLAIMKPHNLGWMALDEPSAQLDMERRHSLASVIARMPMEQVLVVSHDQAFSEACTQVLVFGQAYTL